MSPTCKKSRRFAEDADTCWRARRNHIAGTQGENLRDEGDDFGDFENHVGGRAILQPLTVDITPNPQILRVADFVRCHQARSHRGKSVKTFRPKPLALAELNVAGR